MGTIRNGSQYSEATSTATGADSHAEGSFTQAIGDYSHSEGDSGIAQGQSSHVEGSGCSALGVSAHAEGNSTSAASDYSHAGGNGATTVMFAEWARSSDFVAGQYGIVDYFTTTTSTGLMQIYIGGPSVTNKLFIGPSQAYRYTITGMAKDSATNNIKEFKAEGVIVNNAGTTSIVGSTNVSTWANGTMNNVAITLGVSANNTDDSLQLEVQGIAATTINWYFKLEYVLVA